jgi:hypothetical protein
MWTNGHIPDSQYTIKYIHFKEGMQECGPTQTNFSSDNKHNSLENVCQGHKRIS